MSNLTLFEQKYNELKDLVMKDQKRHIYVVAGNTSEYIDLVKSKPAEERWRYKYVSGVDNIRGLNSIEGVYYGSWKQRVDIEAIREQITIIKQVKSWSKHAVEN
jgi:hypothetical protein